MATPAEDELSASLEKIRADLALLTDSVKVLVADSAEIQSVLKSRLTATAKQAAIVGERMLSEATGMGQDALEAAQAQASQAVTSLEGQIRQSPMSAVLVALGLGFFLGLINRK